MSKLIEAVKANDIEEVRYILRNYQLNNKDFLNEIEIALNFKDLDPFIQSDLIYYLKIFVKTNKDLTSDLILQIIDSVEQIILDEFGCLNQINCDYLTQHEVLALFEVIFESYKDSLKDRKNTRICMKLNKILTPLTFVRENQVDYFANNLRNKLHS